MVAETVLGWRYYGPIEGTVVALDRSGSNRPRVILATPDLGKISKPRTPAYIRVSFHSEDGLAHLRPGARIRTIGSLTPPAGPAEPGGFDFQHYTWFKRLGAVGYSRKPAELIVEPQLNSYTLHLFHLRMQVADYIRSRVKNQSGAFAAAILAGDRSAIDPAILEDLRASNLAHLLAISGLHMGLLVGFVFAFIRYGLALIPYIALHWPVKKIGAILAIIIGFFYLQLSGSAVATERAFIMITVMLIGVLLDRPAITLRAVAIAATILLVLHPESLLQPGFQMSFAATTALVAVFEYLKHLSAWQALYFGRLRFVQPFAALFLSSLVAGAATAPFAAYHFNQFAQFGLIANLGSVPVMGFLVMPAAVIAGLLAPFGLDAVPFWMMGQGIDWILTVAHWVAGLDGAVVAVPKGHASALPLLAFGILVFLLWRGQARWCGLLMCLSGFLIWAITPRPDVLIADTGRLIGIMQENGRALNRDRGSGFVAGVWLENDGDRADQITASARSNVFSDEMIMRIEDITLAYIWPKKTPVSVLEDFCAQSDILIAPNSEAELRSNCFYISKTYLRKHGAVALLISKSGFDIKTAREMTGNRIWNTWWIRKNFRRETN